MYYYIDLLFRYTIGVYRVVTKKRFVVFKNITIDLKEYKGHNKKLLLLNAWEKDEVKLLEKYIEENDSIIELGTGLGFFSAICVKKCGVKNIVTIEANTNLINKIKRLYKLNAIENIVLLNLIIGPKPVYNFYISPSVISSSLFRKKNSTKTKVKGMSFQKLVTDYPYNFIVMDIEGGEYDLLLYNEIPSFVNKLLIEFHGIASHSTKENCQFIDIQEKLKSENFQLLSKIGRVNYYQRKA